MVDFQNIGVLGCGNMGAALVRGLVASGTAAAKDVYVYDTLAPAMESLKRELGVQAMVQAHDLPDRCDVLILAVKPQIFHHIAPGLKPKSGPKERVVLSVMAGVTSENIRSHFPEDYQIVRVMPNLPLSVGEGATAIETDGNSEATLLLAEHIFKATGRTVRVTASIWWLVTRTVRPAALKICSASSRVASELPSVSMAVAPSPTDKGRLGMTRTIW